MCPVERDDLAAAQSDIEEQGDDRGISCAFRVDTELNGIEEGIHTLRARPPRVPVRLALHAVHVERPHHEAEAMREGDERPERGGRGLPWQRQAHD